MSSKSLASPRHAQEPTVDDLSGGGIVPRTGAIGAELPLPDTKRWVASRKAALVAAVRNGILDLEEVCRRYAVSQEEFCAWERAIEAHGVASLQISRLQIYRNAPLRGKPH